MSFHSKLLSLLKTDPRFVDDDGELIPAAVMDAAWKIDRDLVKLLLSDKEIKAKFFEEIEGHWIFNINTFLEYISQKNFLDNSYTRFRNRIGLTIGSKFLRERGEVALVWPYKDCYLEGGQTKEEERRREIFFNEVLAQDEITRLLDPKVLTHFTRYTARPVIASREAAKQSPRKSETASGLDTAEERRLLDSRSDMEVVEERVTDFRRDENGVIRENLIIKGNNLVALHTLKTQFRGRVKLIYIDPPYNTGNDSFGYNDSFNHSTWLTFMKNRLEVAKELLQINGVIFIQCDDNEQAYLKIMMDEIFRRENFIAELVWKKKYTGGKHAKHYVDLHEYILVYAKDIANVGEILMTRPENEKAKFTESDKYLKERGKYYIRPLKSNLEARPTLVYPIKMPDGKSITTQWLVSKDTFMQLLKEERVEFRKKRNGEYQIYKKYYEKDADGKVKVPSLINEFPNTEGKYELKELFDIKEGRDNVFYTVKPVNLIKYLIKPYIENGDRILDFFAGSGTTAQAVLELSEDNLELQFILCEQMEYVEEITKKRVLKVIENNKSGEFIYCELMKYNEAFMERIKAAQSSEELLHIWREMAEGSFLKWYVNPQVPEEAVRDFEALGKEENGLEKQKHLLAELLDKNQLYVNLSEIDDAQFKVSEEDKALNKSFYGEGL